MDHKRLAFTLLKTVVTARDGGREVPPTVATAWALLRAELRPAHRVISDEVGWRRDQQSDLKFVIDALTECFADDPVLAAEVRKLLESSRVHPGAVDAPTRREERVAVPAPPTSPPPPGAPASGPPPSRPANDAGALDTSRPPPADAPRSPPPATKAAAISPPARARLVGVALATAAVLSVGAVYRLALRPGTPPPVAYARPAAPAKAPSLVNAPTPSPAPRLPSPPRTASDLRAAGEYATAREAQRVEVARLDAAGAPAGVRSAAYVELATLSAANGRYRDAVEAQREGLELAYQARPDDTVALGRTHLSLGRYYHQTGQLMIARAHLRQARHYAGQAQDILAAEALSREADALGEALVEGS